MLSSLLAWVLEKVLGAAWHRFFPAKTAASEERKEADEMQKPAGSWNNTIDKL